MEQHPKDLYWIPHHINLWVFIEVYELFYGAYMG